MPEKRTRRDKASYFGTDEVYSVVKNTTREEVPLQTISLEDTLANETPSLTQITQEEPQALFSGTDEVYDVVKDEEVPLSIHLEHNVAYGKTKPSNEQQPVPVVYDTPLLLRQQEDEYSKDTTRKEVSLQSISLQDNPANETPSLTQKIQEPQVLYSGTDEVYDVVKDATRQEVPLQSIHLKHNVAYGETKPSNEQQPPHVVYDTPLLLQQQEEEYSNFEYEDTEDEDEDDYI